jgi:hypothetical protein
MAVTVKDLWKLRTLFDQLSAAYAKFYSTSEHVAVDEVTVLFKGRFIFEQYIHKKHKHFGIKVYKLCSPTSCTYSMNVHMVWL